MADWPVYPCLGGCGTPIPLGPGTCLECWRALKTYDPREVRMLPPGDYRRERVRDPRDRRRPLLGADPVNATDADWAVHDDADPVPGHRLLREQHGQATIVRCECGRWDGGWLGPRSRRRVLDDHAAHVAAELSAAGPLIVPSERADQPKEIEP